VFRGLATSNTFLVATFTGTGKGHARSWPWPWLSASLWLPEPPRRVDISQPHPTIHTVVHLVLPRSHSNASTICVAAIALALDTWLNQWDSYCFGSDWTGLDTTCIYILVSDLLFLVGQMGYFRAESSNGETFVRLSWSFFSSEESI
jgi:hypothetical protein